MTTAIFNSIKREFLRNGKAVYKVSHSFHTERDAIESIRLMCSLPAFSAKRFVQIGEYQFVECDETGLEITAMVIKDAEKFIVHNMPVSNYTEFECFAREKLAELAE